jgi:6-phosphogluconolactonase/glucosamine-6-phosphate isomerase/deaminase
MALEHVVELVIFATGAAKRNILREARLKAELPVAVAAEVAESNGAEVRWLYDDAAWGEK